eukprot:c11057_g1_i1.p1 GENE.c11057_g1_i1~~c11057_g1_i1.p1  ORF type:complete len:269 (+),score=38.13 c11057_g1_i1:75-809(+)
MVHDWDAQDSGKLPISKAYWSAHEDSLLRQLVQACGPKNWSTIAKSFKGRVGKQCRERWRNHLNPQIRKDPFTQEEDNRILELVLAYGTKWTQIATQLPGRTDNSIKNRYYSALKRTHTLQKRHLDSTKSSSPDSQKEINDSLDEPSPPTKRPAKRKRPDTPFSERSYEDEVSAQPSPHNKRVGSRSFLESPEQSNEEDEDDNSDECARIPPLQQLEAERLSTRACPSSMVLSAAMALCQMSHI